MMKKSSIVLVMSASGLLTYSANAQSHMSSLEAGTSFIYNDGRVENFVRHEGEHQVWATRSGREYIKSGNIAQPILEWKIGEREGTREVFGNADALWPIASGTRARFRVLTEVTQNGKTRRSVQPWSCRIGKAEALTVAAGTFNTLPVVCERFSINTMRLLERRTWWWAEDVGHYVRRRYQNLRSGDARDIKLCSALPPHRATPARVDALRKQGC